MLVCNCVNEAPKQLKHNEMVITKPDFMEEIIATRGRRGVSKAASVRSLRDILMVLTDKYDNTINPYHLKLHQYENMVYDGDKGFSDLVLKITKELGLPLIEKAIETKLKSRKAIVDTVYYVSDDLEGIGAFIKLGFNINNLKDAKKNTKNNENVV